MRPVNGDRGDGSRLARALLVVAIAVSAIGLTVAGASGASIRTLAVAIATAPSSGLDAALRAAGSATGIETNAAPRGRAPVTLTAARRLNPGHHHGTRQPPTPVVGESSPTAPVPAPPAPPVSGTAPGGGAPPSPPTEPEPEPEVPSPPADTTAPQTSITGNPATGTTDT